MADRTCNASLSTAWRPDEPPRRCSREAGHYDESREPTFGEDGWTSDPGGWHVTAGPEPTVWSDQADGATPHSDTLQESEQGDRQPTSARERLLQLIAENQPGYERDTAYDPAPGGGFMQDDEYLRRVEELMDAYAHELVDRARRGVAVMEESLGAYQCAKEVREILDVVDPTTADPEGWDF